MCHEPNVPKKPSRSHRITIGVPEVVSSSFLTPSVSIMDKSIQPQAALVYALSACVRACVVRVGAEGVMARPLDWRGPPESCFWALVQTPGPSSASLSPSTTEI
uniref:Uncharacterized protein n=1 Tax=Knipowitschia caucasica TaxID=637954 RepID=A0AAV2JI32_KNICA